MEFATDHFNEQPTLKNLTANYGKPSNKQNQFLCSLGKPHLDSFNYMLHTGLNQAVRDIKEINFTAGTTKYKIKFEDVKILPPLVPPATAGVKNQKIFPNECREGGGTYNGRLLAKIAWSINESPQIPILKDLGRIPIMVKSDLCHLKGLSPEELIKHNEHEDEWGGYFVIKGSEKLVRMLLTMRRNFPIAIKRKVWKQRGQNFSDMGVMMRCVKSDQTSVNNVLHFLTDGTAKLMISCHKTLYFLPVILVMKCLIDVSDEFIFKSVTTGFENDFYLRGCILNMLRTLQSSNIITTQDAKSYLGQMFRPALFDLPKDMSDSYICDFILENCVCIHLNDNRDKFNCLVFMIQKLYSLVQNKCFAEGADAIMSQEVVLAGHLYLQILKGRLQVWLSVLRAYIIRAADEKSNFQLDSVNMDKLMKKCGSVQGSLDNFLSTGNMPINVNVSAPQDKGLVIVLENINRMRYMAHFKSIHRGSYFVEMQTTEVRQLLPDAWGFICPVHTPDGSPCGLLNHLTKFCQVTDVPDESLVNKLPEVLVSLGMLELGLLTGVQIKDCYPVMLDGRLIGYVQHDSAQRLVNKLRIFKISGEKVPNTLEIVLLPKKETISQFPGLYLCTGPARLMRPVYNLAAQQIELIGTLEQVYLDICITSEEAYEGKTTHQELSKDSFLSNLASLIPMPDCNQSPRNMYQCQMGKQTMGTACHTWHRQAQTKLYRLQTPASPLFRPVHYDNIELDNYAMGVNAIVAVISYTGYDMEDAMIINRASLERGFAHGSIQKSELIELKTSESYFGLDPEKPDLQKHLGDDGLPFPGARLCDRTPFYCYYNGEANHFTTEYYKGNAEIVIDNVRLCGSLPRMSNCFAKACITYRVPRNPNVGDKFASRAGQKGICSYKWNSEDLPFTETGIVPDIVFNPHGFPSRMTIAMMLECMAGKSAAVHGLVHDASPFKFNEEYTAVDYFGKLLQAGGYDYYGTERMYSGLNGREITADIFFGIVYYQRLRHMVTDKWQVRSTGAVDVVTKQPVKGRRRGGGVRFGEMERDALLSHGANFLLQDRLFDCSDKSQTMVCHSCGLIISPIVSLSLANDEDDDKKGKKKSKFITKCKYCEDGGQIEVMPIPHIYKFLTAELAALNIKTVLCVDS